MKIWQSSLDVRRKGSRWKQWTLHLSYRSIFLLSHIFCSINGGVSLIQSCSYRERRLTRRSRVAFFDKIQARLGNYRGQDKTLQFQNYLHLSLVQVLALCKVANLFFYTQYHSDHPKFWLLQLLHHNQGHQALQYYCRNVWYRMLYWNPEFYHFRMYLCLHNSNRSRQISSLFSHTHLVQSSLECHKKLSKLSKSNWHKCLVLSILSYIRLVVRNGKVAWKGQSAGCSLEYLCAQQKYSSCCWPYYE